MSVKDRIEQLKLRAKQVALTAAVVAGGKSNVAAAQPQQTLDKNIAPIEINASPRQFDTDSLPDDLFAQNLQLIAAERQFAEVSKSGKYKGLQINYAATQAQDIGHVFESGMNPTAYNGRYIGWYQMSLAQGGLMSQFVRNMGQKYPNLRGKSLTSQAFRQAYNAYATGQNKDAFNRDLFNFNFDKVYAPIFNSLARNLKDFPQINKENCNSPQYMALAGAIMSCANQNPKRTREFFAQAWNQHYAQGKFNPQDEISAMEFYGKVIATSYDIRQSKWGMATRYREEKKLALALNNYNIAAHRLELVKLKTNVTRSTLAENTTARKSNLNFAYLAPNQR